MTNYSLCDCNYKVDPIVRITARGNGETYAIVFVDSFRSAKQQLQSYNAQIISDYPFISAYGVSINIHRVDELSKLNCVKSISSQSTVLTTMDRARACIGSLSLGDIGLSGRGRTVAVIDTGACSHMDFCMPRNRLEFVDIEQGLSVPYDNNGHGTAVASILCGNGLISGGKLRGIAPLANLLVIKAISDKGDAGALKILEAMQYLYNYNLTKRVDVVCMSFGSQPLEVDPLMMGAEALWRSGIVVVASAGNSGPAPSTIMSPSCSPYVISVGGAECVPHSAQEVATGDTPSGSREQSSTEYSGGSDKRGEHSDMHSDKINMRADKMEMQVAEFSSRGPCGLFHKPDIIAPAVDINCCGNRAPYVAMSGTSMATPIVAGICALIREKFPHYTPDKVKEVLLHNATKLNCDIDSCGYGLVNCEFLL